MRPQLPLAAAFAVVCTASGLASVFNITLSSWFMDNSSRDQPATDYSVMACAHVATYAAIGGFAGMGAKTLGYPAFFATSGALALVLALVALPWLRRLARPVPAPIAPSAVAAV